MNLLKENRHILIVDDLVNIHEDFKKILTPKKENYEALNKMGNLLKQEKTILENAYEIDFALQGQQAINLVKTSIAQNNPYAMAFVDIQMPPGFDGVETIKIIWQLDPDIQIVICTAYAKYSWGDLTSILGPSDKLFILKKPFDKDEVMSLTNSLTRRWNLDQEVKKRSLELKETAKQESSSTSSKGNLKEAINRLTEINEKLRNQKF